MQGVVRHQASDLNVRLRRSLAWTSTAAGGADMGYNNRFGTSAVTTSGLLHERLDEVLVLELLQDGGRRYMTLSVRSLYKHVLAAITAPQPENVQSVDVNVMTSIKEDIPGTPPIKEDELLVSSCSDTNNNNNTTTSVTSSSNEQQSQQRQSQGDNDYDDTSADADASSSSSPPNMMEMPNVVLGSLAHVTNMQEEESEITFQNEQEALAQQQQLRPTNPPPPQQQARAASSDSSSSFASPNPPAARSSERTTKANSGSGGDPDMTHRQQQQQQQERQRYSRSKSINFFSTMQQQAAEAQNTNIDVTYRERLGGYLHPRDMRRLVTHFSSSNEPDLIVRRHAMLLNFDPLRAIILHDRLLVLIPDGADSMLADLERRVRGGSKPVRPSWNLDGSKVAGHQHHKILN
jgi:hypothetical protein